MALQPPTERREQVLEAGLGCMLAVAGCRAAVN